MDDPDKEIRRLLAAWNEGDSTALEKLIPLVFSDLRMIARRCFAGESPSHTLQPTALVNELFIYLEGRNTVDWKSPAHFFGTAAKKIRYLLVDYAQYRHAERRGGNIARVSLDEEIPLSPRLNAEDLITVDKALVELDALEPRQCQVVELKFFVGLTIEEIARLLEIKPTTVKKDWRVARAWLYSRLQGEK